MVIADQYPPSPVNTKANPNPQSKIVNRKLSIPNPLRLALNLLIIRKTILRWEILRAKPLLVEGLLYALQTAGHGCFGEQVEAE